MKTCGYILLIAISILLLSLTTQAMASCLGFEPEQAQLSGVVESMVFPGSPNFESIANGDEPEKTLILRLDEGICVQGVPGTDFGSEIINDVKSVDLLVDNYNDCVKYAGSRVTVKGTLAPATTGHHHADVIMTVNSMVSGLISQNVLNEDGYNSSSINTSSESSSSTNYNSTSDTSNQNTKKGIDFTPIIISLLILNLIICIILHKLEKLTIYTDYTDAGLTFAGILFPLMIWGIASLANFDPTLISKLSIASCVVSFYFILRSTYVHNSNIAFTVMALLAKLTSISIYALFLIGNSGAGSKRSGESDVAYQLRKSHENLKSAIFFIIYTALFVFLTKAMTRKQYFAPLEEHLSLDFKRV